MSEFLYRAGIDGVKYPVDSYGGKGVKDGDKAGWNYVAFSDEHIRVDHKWAGGQLRFSRGQDVRRAKEEEKFAAAVGGLTAGRKDGTLAAVDQKRLTAVMRGLGSGELKHPRFTREEAAASGGTEHERLWNYILSLESPDVHARGAEAGAPRDGGDASQGGDWLGQFRGMATRYGSDPRGLIDSSFKFLDKGAESRVYVGENADKVLKVRKLSPWSLDGVKSELAKLVYHNYLFPKDAYTLRDIAVWDNNGYDEFYLILEQPLVTPKTDAAGNIVAPSEGQIFEALKKANRRFRMHDDRLFQARGESFADTAAFVWAMGKQVFNDLGGRTIVRPRRNEIEVAESSGAKPPSFAEKAWDFVLNDIPVLSGVLGGSLRMTLTKEQRLDQVERELLVPIRKVKDLRSEEIMEMMLKAPVANTGDETPEIKEMLDAWAKRYDWDQDERDNVFARALNGYQAATAGGRSWPPRRRRRTGRYAMAKCRTARRRR